MAAPSHCVQQVVAERASQGAEFSIGLLEFGIVDFDDDEPFVVEGGLAAVRMHGFQYI
jgi:hypothetical protein